MDVLDRIMNASDLPREKVAVPEWNGAEVWVCTMSGKERFAFEQWYVEAAPKAFEFMCRLLAATLRREDGTEIFGVERIELLGRKSVKVLERLYEVARRLNGIGAEGESLEGKSEGTPSGSSASGSPSTSA